MVKSRQSGSEIILTHEGSSGSGHFRKEIRIFIDKDDNLEKVFSYPLVEEHYFSGIYPKEHIAFAGEVEFSESNEETGYRDLIVKTTKYIFSNDQTAPLLEGEDKGIFAWGGEVLKKEDLGTMRFRWDGEQHEYALVGGEVPIKLAEKYAYEEKVYDNIEKKGKKIGNMIFW